MLSVHCCRRESQPVMYTMYKVGQKMGGMIQRLCLMEFVTSIRINSGTVCQKLENPPSLRYPIVYGAKNTLKLTHVHSLCETKK